jgi:predicted TIM-barrel fold metal-dependent hydrolase
MARFIPPLEAYMHRRLEPKTEAEMADDFRQAGVLAMMIAWDAESATGDPIVPNDSIARLTREFPDVFLPGWAVVDPWKGKTALRELERAVTTLGLAGAKFQPQIQAFFPNDERHYPIWDLCQGLGAPVLIHTGLSGIGTGMPGGGGIKLKYGKPIPCIDDVAADFPDLTLIAAHPAWPWENELIAVLLHKTNVYMDISGWRPKYFPPSIKREINGRLQDKVLFGSDYPSFPPGQYLDEFIAEGYKPEVVEKVFYKNALRVLKLEDRLAGVTFDPGGTHAR